MFQTGHSAVIGTLIAPLMLLGGPLVLRAAAVTGGVVGALSLTAACAPDGKFLTWGGPLAIGLGGVFMACLGELGLNLLTLCKVTFQEEWMHFIPYMYCKYNDVLFSNDTGKLNNNTSSSSIFIYSRIVE